MKDTKSLGYRDAQIDHVEGLSKELNRLVKRIQVSNLSARMSKIYCRSVRGISIYTGVLPKDLDLDEVIDYLLALHERGQTWSKIKLDVAGLRYYFRELLDDEELTSKIPYPKEEKSLPSFLSREELLQLFNACKNPKHRIILRLIYCGGLRRTELINQTHRY